MLLIVLVSDRTAGSDAPLVARPIDWRSPRRTIATLRVVAAGARYFPRLQVESRYLTAGAVDKRIGVDMKFVKDRTIESKVLAKSSVDYGQTIVEGGDTVAVNNGSACALVGRVLNMKTAADKTNVRQAQGAGRFHMLSEEVLTNFERADNDAVGFAGKDVGMTIGVVGVGESVEDAGDVGEAEGVACGEYFGDAEDVEGAAAAENAEDSTPHA